ncbi:MAG: hypothetical protein L6V93_17845 [Clostridiales bacterium]|nr:MAG: hypothetical protein L6V93_17845 [Clostridiales bacterium]
MTIDTPYRGAKESSETLTRRRSSADGTMLVKNMNTFNAGYTFDLKYYTAKDAMHIGYEKASPDEFYHTSYPNEKALALDLYSLGTDTLQCVIAVAESSASEDKYEDNFALITKVRRTLNSDEDEIYKVSAVYGGKEVTFNTRDLAAHPISGIKEGNIVPISLDSKNRLLSAGTAVFSYDNFKKGRSVYRKPELQRKTELQTRAMLRERFIRWKQTKPAEFRMFTTTLTIPAI